MQIVSVVCLTRQVLMEQSVFLKVEAKKWYKNRTERQSSRGKKQIQVFCFPTSNHVQFKKEKTNKQKNHYGIQSAGPEDSNVIFVLVRCILSHLLISIFPQAISRTALCVTSQALLVFFFITISNALWSSLSPRCLVTSVWCTFALKKNNNKNKTRAKTQRGKQGFAAGWRSCKLLLRIPTLSSSSCPRRLS